MKRYIINTFIFIVSFSFTYGNKAEAQHTSNSIEIHDNQYACYNSMIYFIIDSTFSIGNYSEEGDMYDSGYTQEEYLDTLLSNNQLHAFDNFMKHFPFRFPQRGI